MFQDRVQVGCLKMEEKEHEKEHEKEEMEDEEESKDEEMVPEGRTAVS